MELDSTTSIIDLEKGFETIWLSLQKYPQKQIYHNLIQIHDQVKYKFNILPKDSNLKAPLGQIKKDIQKKIEILNTYIESDYLFTKTPKPISINDLENPKNISSILYNIEQKLQTNQEVEKSIEILYTIFEKHNSYKDQIANMIKRQQETIQYYLSTLLLKKTSTSKTDFIKIKTLIEYSLTGQSTLHPYTLIRKMIFEQKDVDLLTNLLKQNPMYINIKTYDQQYLLDLLVDIYINQLLNQKYQFQKQIIETFLNIAGLSMEISLKYQLLQKIKDTLETYPNKTVVKTNLTQLKQSIETILTIKEIPIENTFCLQETSKKSQRKFEDRLNKPIITIDSEHTQYYENAIFCEQQDHTYLISVYVSDILDCLTEPLVLQKNELRHQTYKNKQTRLPKYILKENKTRFAIAFEIQTDEKLNVLDIQVKRTRVCIKKNYTINQVTDILNEKNSQNEDFYLLQKMNNLARLMYKKRNPNKKLKPYIQFISEIQREFNFFVNQTLAKDAYQKQITLLYKNKLPYNTNSLYQILTENNQFFNEVQGLIEKGVITNYSTIYRGEKQGEIYTPITSPTRNLICLLNQLLVIRGYIEKGSIEEDKSIQKVLTLLNHIQISNQKQY